MYSNRFQRDLVAPPPVSLPLPSYHPPTIEQWASRVVKFSSEYNNRGWGAEETLGPPKVYPKHGDVKGAWASGSVDDKQFIELEYATPVIPTAIHIYETFNPGAVVAVKVLDEHGVWETLWQALRPECHKQSRIFSPPLKDTPAKTNLVRLEVNCTKAKTWCEIDAVQLVGVGIPAGGFTPIDNRDPETNPAPPQSYNPLSVKQWAARVVRFSSQYNDTCWSAEQVLGEPKVYPNHGDFQGAWATGNIDEHQYIELEFDEPVIPTAIKIYETFNPGAVVAIKVIDKEGHWDSLWKTPKAECHKKSRIFSPPLKEAKSQTSVVRLELDCTKANTWCEIDAVMLIGTKDGAVGPVNDEGLIASLHSLVDNKQFSDCKFDIGGKILHGHKAILASRCQYFAKMFGGKDKDTVVLKLPHTSHSDMKAIFYFLYTNRLPKDCNRGCLINLTDAAMTLNLPELKTIAMHKILQTLRSDNVIDTFLCLESRHKDLKDMCVKFMAENLAEVSSLPGFDKLPQEILVPLVRTATANLSINSEKR